MKITKLKLCGCILLSGCTSYQPYVVPANHPANFETSECSSWDGPKALTQSPALEEKKDNMEVPIGSAHHHMHGMK